MEYSVQVQKLCLIDARRYILMVGMVGITYLMLQYFMLPYGTAHKPRLPNDEVLLSVRSGVSSSQLLVKSTNEREVNPSNLGLVKQHDRDTNDIFGGSDYGLEVSDRIVQDTVSLEDKGQGDLGHNEVFVPEVVDLTVGNSSRSGSDNASNIQQVVGSEHDMSGKTSFELNESSIFDGNENVLSWNQADIVLPDNAGELEHIDLTFPRDDSKVNSNRRKKKVRPGMPPISVVPIDEMNRRLARHVTSSTKVKPRWSSLRDSDKEIFDAKSKIINAPASSVDKELYAPLFRNVSMFMRSYELMEKTLKVYVYRDGRKPIFHQPILKGLYASEGWFMKLIEGNKHFSVKDPEKAHLFYMPFSSRMLEYALYVPNSHNRTKLRQFVKSYTETIAAKYPFWNRTGGADHLVVACHDWAPYETRHHMENSIKALCNADVTIGFKIGRDVSLPETFVRYARNPLRGLGGKPPSKRNILAFYAGNSHGYLRPILLKHWKDKDPDMRIYGLLPTGVSRKMNYAQHMKSSKFCVCPKGYEVNSPRIVEAIFNECVPVIISDNFVPAFFEVLNWEAFSVIVAEKDIPNLKTILLSISDEKYRELHLAVRKIQRHFLWHARPVKYDLFHMTLHSIWYNRVFQIRRQ